MNQDEPPEVKKLMKERGISIEEARDEYSLQLDREILQLDREIDEIEIEWLMEEKGMSEEEAWDEYSLQLKMDKDEVEQDIKRLMEEKGMSEEEASDEHDLILDREIAEAEAQGIAEENGKSGKKLFKIILFFTYILIAIWGLSANNRDKSFWWTWKNFGYYADTDGFIFLMVLILIMVAFVIPWWITKDWD